MPLDNTRTDIALSEISLGEAEPAAARTLLARLLKAPGSDTVMDIYLALRAWVWKALDRRRRDPELRDWHDIITGVAASLPEIHRGVADRLGALEELLAESVAVSETVRPVDVMRRRHVSDILTQLSESADGAADRAAIGRETGLGQANLTRVLNLMQLAGLIERVQRGRDAVLRLTPEGWSNAKPQFASTSSTAAPPDARLGLLMAGQHFTMEVVKVEVPAHGSPGAGPLPRLAIREVLGVTSGHEKARETVFRQPPNGHIQTPKYDLVTAAAIAGSQHQSVQRG